MLAMEQLMKSYSYEDITISQITDLCNVSRPVFYKYFIDKYDLCLQMIDYFCNKEMINQDAFTWYNFVRHHLSKLKDHSHFFITLTLTDNGVLFFKVFYELIYQIYYDMICSVLNQKPDARTDFLLKSYCSGGFWMLKDVIAKDKTFSIEPLVKLYEESMPVTIHDLLIGENEIRTFITSEIFPNPKQYK